METLIQRRTILKAAVAATTISVAGLAINKPGRAASRTIRIGIIAPLTGAMAAHAEALPFLLRSVMELTGGTVTRKDGVHEFEFITRDTQSNPNRASEVTQELLLGDGGVDVVYTVGGPENTNPVSDQCELNGVPCIASDVPIEAWFFGRGGDVKTGFEYTFCSFFDVATYSGAMSAFMDKLSTNNKVGGLWANDSDGVVLSKAFTEAFTASGKSVVDPGRFDLPTSSYATQISAFQSAGVEIVQCVVPPADFTLFWSQCAQQGFRPKVVIASKSGEYAPAISPLGDKAAGISVPVWWTPAFPFVSSLTKQKSGELADAYHRSEKRQWSPTLGSHHSMLEVIFDALTRATDVTDKDAIRDAIRDTDLQTISGLVNFRTGPVPNTSKTGLVLVQWEASPAGGPFPYDMTIVDNTFFPNVPVARQPFVVPYV